MATMTGRQWAQAIRQRVEDLKKVCEGVDEATAQRAPEGRWSPKQVLSHLWGAEGTGHLPMLKAYLDRDAPELDLDPGNPFFSEERSKMTFQQLLTGVEAEYEGISRFVEGLSAEQLDRKAHVPMLKASPMGEWPTLEEMVKGIIESHLQFHSGHLQEILQALHAGGQSFLPLPAA